MASKGPGPCRGHPALFCVSHITMPAAAHKLASPSGFPQWHSLVGREMTMPEAKNTE